MFRQEQAQKSQIAQLLRYSTELGAQWMDFDGDDDPFNQEREGEDEDEGGDEVLMICSRLPICVCR